jgi:UDP-2-acetamido-2-deoxy-ribo-hexuluronate aminotransferase
MNKTSIDFIDLKSQYRTLKTSIDDRIQAVLDHGQYIMGPEVGELEDKLAAFVGGGQCITVASGTEALLIALMALGIKAGDEVITSPFTFAATAEVIALVGATPVFVDIEPDTCNIDVRRIEAAITAKTRAIMPVSLYGQAPDMDDINAIADRHNLVVIDDAAQSFGATYRDRRSCALSTIGCTSFFPSKPLGCYGDGGAIFTSNDVLAKAMREIRVHGQERRYHHTRIGVGGRMDTIQCAVVLSKLERFDWELKRREEIAQRYIQSLSGSNAITSPVVRPDRISAWAQFTVQVDHRDQVIKLLNDNGVPTAIHYPIPLHVQPAYRDLCRISGSLANAEHVADRVFSLPMHPYLSEDTQDMIVARLLASVA